MHFILKILRFEEFLHKIALFFKKLVFPEFRSIETVSWPIEIAIKILVWLCVFRSMLDWFWINRRHFRSIESNFRSIESCIESFFLNLCFSYVLSLSNYFKNSFLSLFDWSKIPSKIFVVFFKILQGLLSSYTSKTFLPFFFNLFSFFMHLRDIFKTLKILGILMI